MFDTLLVEGKLVMTRLQLALKQDLVRRLERVRTLTQGEEGAMHAHPIGRLLDSNIIESLKSSITSDKAFIANSKGSVTSKKNKPDQAKK